MAVPKVIRDLIGLYGTRAAEVLIPWIYIPFVVRVIGPELFGTLALATAVSQVFLVLVEFGYPFSGVRSVILHRDFSENLSRYVSSALSIRVAISLVTICGVAIIDLVLDPPGPFGIVLILTCIGSLGYAMTAQFVFHGLEKFSEFSHLTIVMKLLAALGIIVLVRTKEDFLLIPLIQSSMIVLAGFYSIFFLIRKSGIRISIVPAAIIVTEFRRQLRMLVSGIAISLYTSANTLLLGMFTSAATVGYYSAAEKLIRGPLQILTPVQMVLMPRAAKTSLAPERIPVRALTNLLRILLAVVVPISGLLAYYAPEIVTLIYGDSFSPSVVLVRMLTPLPLVMVGTMISADLFLLGFGFHREWSRIIISASIGNIALATILVPIMNLGAHGIVIAILLTEGFVMVSSLGLFLKALKRQKA